MLHYAPLILFTIVYIVVMSDEVLRERYFMIFYVVLYSFSILNLICYTLVAIFANTTYTDAIINREKKQLIRVSGFSLGAMALLFLFTILAGLFSEEGIKDRLPGTILYSGLFVSIAAAFVYRINNLIEDVPLSVVDQAVGRDEVKPVMIGMPKAEDKEDREDVKGKVVLKTEPYFFIEYQPTKNRKYPCAEIQ